MTLNANENLVKNFAALPHVLLVDDDDRIRQLVSRYLSDNNFVVTTAANTAHARTLLERLSFDVLVVDVMMPGENGLDFTKSLAGQGIARLPVLLLTALGEGDDRIAGLEAGADDYLTKPFEPRELVLRLHSLLRRRPEGVTNKNFVIGRWRYDPELQELCHEQESVRLTAVEGNLLSVLAARPGEVLDRDALAALCGGNITGRAIDVQVTRLRRKLESDPKLPRHLQTVRGKGYRLLL